MASPPPSWLPQYPYSIAPGSSGTLGSYATTHTNTLVTFFEDSLSVWPRVYANTVCTTTDNQALDCSYPSSYLWFQVGWGAVAMWRCMVCIPRMHAVCQILPLPLGKSQVCQATHGTAAGGLLVDNGCRVHAQG